MPAYLLEFRKTDRSWPIPVLAGLSVGIPLLAGYFMGNVPGGKLASIAGLVILYIHSLGRGHRMATLMACSFGIMVSFSVGILFSFNPYVACVVLGLFSFSVHLSLYYLNLTRPPGNFFFIMVASIAICMPFDLKSIPKKIGYIGIGTMISCTLGLIYTLLTLNQGRPAGKAVVVTKSRNVNLIEAVTFGSVIGVSLLAAFLLQLPNPYWVPTTAAAVMQGSSTRHVWQRSVQRVVGTLLGLGLAWAILLLKPTLLTICLSIVALQVVVEVLVVRNYGVAVVFITILTIFLAESGNSLLTDPTLLIQSRFYDILMGSVMGAAGGWILYNERLHFIATKQIRKTSIVIRKRRR